MLEKHGMKEELAKKAGSIRNGNGRETEEILAAANETERVDGMEEMEKNRGRDSSNAFVRLPRADEIECRVSVINEKGQWIAKQDVGTVSYSEKEKGQASDSFKRACFNWGLGRELYSAPFIWIPAGTVSIQKKGERFVTSDRFSVQSIAYNEQRVIVSLVIVNSKGTAVFEMGKMRRQGKDKEKEKEGKAGADMRPSKSSGVNEKAGVRRLTDVQRIALEKELERTGVLMEAVLGRYGVRSLDEMTEDVYVKALNGLKRTKTKAA